MWQRILKENYRYIVALGIMLLAMAVFLYGFFGWREISGVYAQNASRADSVNTSIANLPSVSSVVPAQTSGSLDYVVAARSQLIDMLESNYAPKSATWLYVLNPAYYALDARKSQQASINQDLSETLHETVEQLTQLKKIIEYAPLADLSIPFGEDETVAERLSRTKIGIDAAIDSVQSSTLARKAQISKELTELNAQTLSLNDETKVQWAYKMRDVQAQIIEDIANLDIKNTQYSDQLEYIRSLYQ